MAQEQQQQQQQQGEAQQVKGQGAGGGIQRAEGQKGQLATERPSRGMRRGEISSPFSMMSRFMEDMDRLLSGFGLGGFPTLFRPFEEETIGALAPAAWSPAIETFERDGRLVVRADLPGLKPEDVKVEVTGDELVISGERTENKEETRGGRRYSERRYGSFERRFTLPEGCDPENVEASFDNGVLEVSLAAPQREKPRTRKVQIKGGAPKAQPEKGGTEPVH